MIELPDTQQPTKGSDHSRNGGSSPQPAGNTVKASEIFAAPLCRHYGAERSALE
jgi:hypothetical protein